MDNCFIGTAGADNLEIPSYPDQHSYLAGLAGNDTLRDSSSDSLSTFNALYGGSGNDRYILSYGSKTFIADTGGIDTLVLSDSYSSFLSSAAYGTGYIIDGNHYYAIMGSRHIFIQDFYNPFTKIDYIQFSDRSMPFDTVFNQFSKYLIPETSLSLDPWLRQSLYESMHLRDRLAVQEITPFIGYNDFEIFIDKNFNESEYISDKKAQLNKFDNSTYWIDTTVQDAIKKAGLTSEQHYKMIGAFEKNDLGEIGLDPSASFDTSKYFLAKQSLMQKNGENVSMGQVVKAFQDANIDPLTHYFLCGFTEGIRAMEVKSDKIDGMTEWNEAKYYAANPDVADAIQIGLIGSGFEHYALYGQFEGRSLG